MTEGHLRFYYRDGDLKVNDESMDLMGDAYWVSQGAYMNFTMSRGFTYIVGGPFIIDPSVDEFVFTSSYNAPKYKIYHGSEAVNNPKMNLHDSHIGNGTTNARDLAFSADEEKVAPPSITVMNCAPTKEESFVYYHTHPFGAVYFPYTGNICFWTDKTLCVGPNEARWVSANLFYYETFDKIEVNNEGANELVKLAFSKENATACNYPIVFAVTNFDPDSQSGVPNFDSMPNGPG